MFVSLSPNSSVFLSLSLSSASSNFWCKFVLHKYNLNWTELLDVMQTGWRVIIDSRAQWNHTTLLGGYCANYKWFEDVGACIQNTGGSIVTHHLSLCKCLHNMYWICVLLFRETISALGTLAPCLLLTFVSLWFALGRNLFLFQGLSLSMLSPSSQLEVDKFPHHEGLSEADGSQDSYPNRGNNQ